MITIIHKVHGDFQGIKTLLCTKCYGLCAGSVDDGDLGQGRVRDDHRVHQGQPAAAVPHLLCDAGRHGRLLCLPDQVSLSLSVYLALSTPFVPLSRLQSPKIARHNNRFYVYSPVF